MLESSSFASLKRLYDANRFAELIGSNDGIYWLKLRSISRKEQLQSICDRVGLGTAQVQTRNLFKFVFEQRPDESMVDDFIRTSYERERKQRLRNENYLVSQLYQMKVFDWGGLYQNNLERTIVNNFIKKIQDWDELNRAIEDELHNSLQGYVRCSWYNHWSSILIEDIFKDHARVLPTIGLVKKIDFFIFDFPFDLKVTYFPVEYMKTLRRNKGLRPEFTELKRFCRQSGIWFDNRKKEKLLLPELLMKVEELPKSSAREFLSDLRGVRSDIIKETLQDPTELKIWLYENQGDRRFDAANRFFLILIDLDNLEESWKLKRNKAVLHPVITGHLDKMTEEAIGDLRIDFTWNDDVYETYS
ncbi:MAG: hypothetical protein OXN94_10100, partial [Chloroflexota bacterium]|nr:hypothetical protein [Chloroflexota bacterium]